MHVIPCAVHVEVKAISAGYPLFTDTTFLLVRADYVTCFDGVVFSLPRQLIG